MTVPTLSGRRQISKPTAPSTLVELLRERAQQRSFEPLFTFLSDGETEEVTLTYGELEERARAIGWRLQFIGAESERVLLLFPPGLDYIAAFFGCLYAGAIAVPAYPPRLNKKLDRLQAIIADAGVSVILTTSSVSQKAQPLFAQSEQLKGVRWLAVDEIDLDLAFYYEEPEIGADSIAFIQYTSGSTSIPKGVMVTHANLLHNEAMIKDAFRQSEQSVIVGWLPLYHDMGLIGNVLQPLYLGARCILMSPVAFLQRPYRWLSAISRYRATTSGGPNFAYELCLRRISEEQAASLDFSNWKIAFNGAEPIRYETLERFAAAFEKCGFRREALFPCYGLAEATLFVSGGPPVTCTVDTDQLEQGRIVETSSANPKSKTLVASGSLASRQRAIIVDPKDLSECAVHKVGEIWLAGPNITKGYWGRPDESFETFHAQLSDRQEGPFLRTGDVGFLKDGRLFVTGRIKDLIIIRGRNHYPQDIEHTVEKSHEAVRAGCCAAFSTLLDGEEGLVVVLEVDLRKAPDLDELIDVIRQEIVEEHDVQPQVVVLINRGTIPKTSSGKIQRRLCRAQFLDGTLDLIRQWEGPESFESIVEPITAPPLSSKEAIENWIVERLASKLQIPADAVNRSEPLVRYGLDSLNAVELMYEVESSLGIKLDMVSFLSEVSIEEIASLAAAQLKLSSDRSDVSAVAQEEIQEGDTSHGQKALWFINRVVPESPAYNIAGAARLRAKVDVPALVAAFEALIDRHPCLRTTFDVQDGQLIQKVHENITDYFKEEDASSWDQTRIQETILRYSTEPFDLKEGPLLNVILFRVSPDEHILLLVFHHIIADLWSLAVLVRDLGALYTSEVKGQSSNLPEHGPTYFDYVRWQSELLNSETGERSYEYWSKQLRSPLPAFNMATDYTRPSSQSYRGASADFKLSVELTQRLKSLALKETATLYTTLLAAFQLLLHRYSGQDDLLVGSPTSGRSRAAFAEVVGYFVNPVVLRSSTSGVTSFVDFLSRTRKTVLEAFEHRDYPFSLLVEKLQPARDPSRAPLFQVMFAFQKNQFVDQDGLASFSVGHPMGLIRLGDLELESVQLDQRVAQFDLTFLVAEANQQLIGSFQYCSDLFEESTIKRMCRNFETLIDSIVTNAEESIFSLSLLSVVERRQVLEEWNETAVEYPVDKTISELFEQQARLSPDATAVSFLGQSLSYHLLNRRANQLAHYLRSRGVGPEVAVGIMLDRSLDLIVGLIAILKAGGAYVPLDPQYPQQRLTYMLTDSGARLVITQSKYAAPLSAERVGMVLLDEHRQQIAAQSEQDLPPSASGSNLAYIIYTSGSTGQPKGVAIEHHNAVAFINWTRRQFTDQEMSAVLASTSVCFDLSVFEIFATLGRGGKVVIVKDVLELASGEVAAVSLINTVPSAMRQLLELKAVPEGVAVVNLAGEVLSRKLVEEVYAAGAAKRVLNLYGPTEDTTYSTGEEVSSGAREVMIGAVIENKRLYILDERMEAVALGVRGEIYLGGEGQARGYVGRGEQTAERFVPDPFSRKGGERLYRTGDEGRLRAGGRVEYLGRRDEQVKVRGYRIELGEIEEELRKQEGVKESAVIVRGEGEAKELVGYVEVEGEEREKEWKRKLRERLPEYMVPAMIIRVEQMPHMLNGKVDKKLLPLPGRSRVQDADFIPPSTPVEQTLAEVWTEVLGMKLIGTLDNFFNLGGHSLKAAQVAIRLQERFGIDLPLRAILETQNFGDLARAIEEQLVEKIEAMTDEETNIILKGR
jgi:amino acid adenylation domain-containing protein